MNAPDWIEIKVEAEAKQRTEALAALVTPEMASLLEKVGGLVGGNKGWTSIGFFTSQDGERCRVLAARIREALEETEC